MFHGWFFVGQSGREERRYGPSDASPGTVLINTVGLYYVIDGLLDVSMPAEGSGVGEEPDRKRWTEKYRTKLQEKKKPPVKHLFTVSPGGIAGYLG